MTVTKPCNTSVLATVAAGLLMLSGCDDTSTDAPTTGSVAASAAPSTTTEAPFDPSRCGTSLPQPYAEIGSVHTVLPNSLPVQVAMDVQGARACTGGTVTVSVTLVNQGAAEVDMEGTNLLLATVGAEKFIVGRLPSTPVGPGASLTIDVPVYVPPVAPGTYRLFLYGLAGDTTLVVDGPAVCEARQLDAEVVLEDGAGQHQFQVTRVTNAGPDPCVLLPPIGLVTGAGTAGTTDVIPLQPGDGFFGGQVTPLANYALGPGDAADLWTTTSSTCLDGVTLPNVYEHLDVQLGGMYEQLTVAIGRDVDVACGLWLSGWAAPTAS